jgi:cytochrome c-type biogenesis protein
VGSTIFAFAGGILSTLSPCVLPILPVLLGAATARHRWGPAALAAGVAASFTAVGLFLATFGFSLGLDAGILREAAAALLVGLGLVMLVPALEERVALSLSRLSFRSEPWTDRLSGLRGEFLLGLTLGVVWSPCAGPTLGAAAVLAAERRELAQVATAMLAYGLGASLPLVALGVLSRELTLRWRGSLLAWGRHGRAAMGTVAALAGLLIATGLDRPVETWLVDASPMWLTQLTTRF